MGRTLLLAREMAVSMMSKSLDRIIPIWKIRGFRKNKKLSQTHKFRLCEVQAEKLSTAEFLFSRVLQDPI